MRQDAIVIVVDGEEALAASIREPVEALGWRAIVVLSLGDVVTAIRDAQPVAALVGVSRATGDGWHPATAVAEACPRTPVIAVRTDLPLVDPRDLQRTPLAGVLALPIERVELEALIGRVAEQRERRLRILDLEARLAQATACAGMLGRGPRMQEVFDQVQRLAPVLRAAWIVGEAGTGKRRLARVLHAVGPRRHRPFIVIECGQQGGLDLETRLFGHGGSPAVASPALLALADGGVVYFDEAGALPDRVQRRLLPVLERGEWHDEQGRRRADLLVLLGADGPPDRLVAQGRVIPELATRAGGVEFHLPPLRYRREDILPMAAVFLRETAARLGRPAQGLTHEAEALLVDAAWPGNVAQLKDVIERLCLATAGDLVLGRDVAAALPPPAAAPRQDAEPARPLSSVEREHILRALEQVGGNKKAAARLLGVSRRALYRRLERLDLESTIARRPGRRRAAGLVTRDAADRGGRVGSGESDPSAQSPPVVAHESSRPRGGGRRAARSG